MRRQLLSLGASALLLSPPAAAVRGNPARGKVVFRSHCGTCHTLAAAGTHGRVGPSLDFDRLAYSTVVFMARYGDGLMPGFKGVLTTRQIQDLAAFVSAASS
jgi:mono/diheme cytochrome c family protein